MASTVVQTMQAVSLLLGMLVGSWIFGTAVLACRAS